MRAGKCSKCSIKMEDVLNNIKCLSIQLHLEDIKEAAQETLDLLAVQHGSIRDEPFQLRARCFAVFCKCFESKKGKLMSFAISGLLKMVKDDRFHANFEPKDDSKWLPSQLLQATNSFFTLPEETQIDILKVFLNVAHSKYWTLNGRIVISILGLCIDAYESGSTALKAAAQAAACQTLRTFCNVLEEELEAKDEKATTFNEVLPVMQFVTSKIDEGQSSGKYENEVVFQLECMLTLFSSLPQVVQGNHHLRTFTWQKLCPILISLLGTPRVDKNIVTRSGSVEEGRGRGSGGLAAAPSFSSNHAKAVYSISNELVRLFGRLGPLRPVLESVFHRVLLYPPPEYRYDAIKAASELFANPDRVLDMAGPLAEPEIGFQTNEMSLIRLIMDSLEESCDSKSRSREVAISCCVSLLKTLQELCSGRSIPNERAEVIRDLYPKLEDCDYKGPRTYQSAERLPSDYQEKMPLEDCGDVEKQSSSDSLTETDGPDEEDIDEDSKELDEESKMRSEITGNWLTSQRTMPGDLGDTDIQHAHHFIAKLREFLPELRPLRSCIEVDQAVQTFAAEYCIGVVVEHPRTEWAVIINSDAIYFITYSLLALDLTLNKLNHYINPIKRIPMSEDEFVNEVQNSGTNAYLSNAWLRELYQYIVSSSLLRTHQYLPTHDKTQQHALVNLLTDMQGMETCLEGSEMLSECWRLERACFKTDASREVQAGMRLSRKILTCCWDSIFKLLSVPLTRKKYSLKSFNLKNLKFALNENRGKMGKETTAQALEGLLIAANLFSKLGLQDRCGDILELLASASCPPKGERKGYGLLRHDNISSTGCLTTAHALNIELIIGSGLELGSRCSSCWPHVFRSCVYVKKLERNFFSKPENRALRTCMNLIKKGQKKGKPPKKIPDSLQLEENICVDVYSFLAKGGGPETVSQIISSRKTGLSSTDILEPVETARVICTLSQLVDKLFEDAALKLNLKSLESFSRCLCVASHKQLFPPPPDDDSTKSNWWSKFKVEDNNDSYLLLDSLGEVMVKCVRSGRPLIHFMRLWAIIGPYMMESASHKDVAIGLKAVQHIHDMISAYFNVHAELPYFHVNETLFKPFESLLCLELCNAEVRDQIVNCFTKFCEANYNELYSGWRPIFSALRALPEKVDRIADIFGTFLETSDPMVFANSAVDFILCLLTQIGRSRHAGGITTEEFPKYLLSLRRVQGILSTFYKVSRGLIFSSAHRIQVSEPMLVDPYIPNVELVIMDNVPDDLIIESKVSYSAFILHSLGPTLDSIDRPSGALRVWMLLLQEMNNIAIAAKPEYQPKLLDTFCNDLIELRYQADYLFNLYCLNRFVLPMTQGWLRQLSKNDNSDYSGFKQAIGLLSDMIEGLFVGRTDNERTAKSLNLLVTQIMLLLTECCIHSTDSVATLASACFRHILNEAGYYFNPDQWKVSCLALHKACEVTLVPIRQLMMAFSKGSQSFYGDNNQIKIAARSDATLRDIIHLKQLSQQVFLLDCQREEIVNGEEDELVTERSYTFLLTVSDEVVVRIPMKTLVSSLLSHQSLLNVIGNLLLQDTNRVLPSLAKQLFINLPPAPQFGNQVYAKPFITGFKGLLSSENIKMLLSCLDLAYQTAVVFDSRPGLKFLVQKVASLERAANLYRQARAAWIIQMVTLFDICATHIENGLASEADIKRLLETPETENQENQDDFEIFLRKLHRHFSDLCSTYVDLVSDKDEAEKSPEKKPDQPFEVDCEDKDDPAGAGDTDKEEDWVCKHLPGPFVFSDFPSQRYDFPSSSSSDEGEEDYEKRKWMKLAEDLRQGLKKIEDIKLAKMEMDEKLKRQGGAVGDDVDEESAHDIELVTEVLREYRRRKNNYLKNKGKGRKKSSNASKPAQSSVPPELEKQRNKSFMKDEEARRRSFSDMFGVVFEMLGRLNEDHFRIILPVFFDGIRTLTPHASDMPVKKVVAALFHRISIVFGFGLP